MAYSLNFTNGTGLSGMFQWANQTVGYSFGWAVIMALGIIIFVYLSSRYEDQKYPFAYTTFVCATLAGFAFMFGMVEMSHFIIYIILAVAGLVWLLGNR